MLNITLCNVTHILLTRVGFLIVNSFRFQCDILSILHMQKASAGLYNKMLGTLILETFCYLRNVHCLEENGWGNME